MDQNGHSFVYYVYAVVRPRDGQAPRSPACDRSGSTLAGFPRPLLGQGITPAAAVQTWAERGLEVIYSAVPFADFGRAGLEAHLEDTEWARARILAHQRVLAALLDGYTLLPFKFCTIFQSESDVRGMLARHGGSFDRALRRVTGAIEWGVKLYCDLVALSRWVESTHQDIQPLRASVAQASPGAGFFLRKRLAQAAGKIAEQIAQACVEESHRRLAECSREAIANPIQRREAHGRDGEMALNAAYLVPEPEQAAFQDALAGLAWKYAAPMFLYELTGPWPPYNFAVLESEISDEFGLLE